MKQTPGTGEGIFQGCQIVLDLDAAQVRFKQKQELRKKITSNGGIISYIITKKSSHLIVSNVEKAKDSYKGRMAQKYGIPVLAMDYIDICVEEDKLVDPEPHIVCGTSVNQEFSSGKIVLSTGQHQVKPKASKVTSFNINKIRVYPLGSDQAPAYPDSYEIAKYALLQRTDPKTKEWSFYLLELHAIPPPQIGGANIKDEVSHPYRVMVHHGKLSDIKHFECRYSQTSVEALQVYSFLYHQREQSPWNMTKSKRYLYRWLGSPRYRKLMLERGMSHEPMTQEIARLVDHVWQEALGQLADILTVPVETISIDKVEKAEAVLLQIKRSLDQSGNATQLKEQSQEFYSLIPQRALQDITTRSMIAKKQNLCQLIKDIVGVSEATDWSTRSSLDAKYRALRCHIESLPENHHEFNDIKNMVLSSQTGKDNMEVMHVYAVSRAVEETNFASNLDNKSLLFHASRPSNFVGILSRGLLLPKIVVDDLGGERTDVGMLGSAIYFADSSSTSAKYSAASKTSGTRLMVVNQVALGKCKEVVKYQKELTEPPQGYHSVHGVKETHTHASDFKDDEFAVYNTNQQRIRYLVEFKLPEDNPKELNSSVAKEMAAILDPDHDTEMETLSEDSVDLKDVQSVTDPMSKVQAGLQSKNDQPVPLKAVHVRAKLLDLAAEVVVLQVYTNENDSPIEAKYVFPLDDMAAVCGFEAFINDKHIVGEVKEKETAHKEYKAAISKGHGAYLMDEETPDVFTVSVGNLPPNTTVVIKIVYMAELSVDGDKIVFGLPGSVAPWKKDSALSEVTQTDVKTVKVDEEMKGNLSVVVSIEMPYDIRTVESPSHPIRIKQTSSKATVSLAEGCTRLDDGFQLHIGLAEIHVPRMWVERHPSKKDSQACMLTFYPEFEASIDGRSEVVFMLDLSNSMKGESLTEAKKIVLLALHHLPEDWVFNIVGFGTAFDELFASGQPKSATNLKKAQTFLCGLDASMGSTEVWHPLQTYFLLRSETLRNVFLISDGHINNEESTLRAVHQNAMHTRLFTCGVSSTANRHLLRALARVGSGSFQFFDSKVKSKWETKVKSQLNKAAQPVLSSVSVNWQQFDNHAPRPIQAPNQITSLFSGSRQVVYGFVPFCTQATLKALIAGKEVSTMVSTHELSITEGKMLHQLTARAIIRDWEDGTLDVNRTEHEVKKTEQKDYIIDLSKEYSIVTQFTSFVAIETRDKDEDRKDKKEVDIEELLKTEEIDALTYMGWEKTACPPGHATDVQEVPAEETIEKLLSRAQEEEPFSILTAQRCYEEAVQHSKTHLDICNPVSLKAMLKLLKFYYDVQRDPGKVHEFLLVEDFVLDSKEDVYDWMENMGYESQSEATEFFERLLREKKCDLLSFISESESDSSESDSSEYIGPECLLYETAGRPFDGARSLDKAWGQPYCFSHQDEVDGVGDLCAYTDDFYGDVCADADVDVTSCMYEMTETVDIDLDFGQTSDKKMKKKTKKKSYSPTSPFYSPTSPSDVQAEIGICEQSMDYADGASCSVEKEEVDDKESVSESESEDAMGFGLFDNDDHETMQIRAIKNRMMMDSQSQPASAAPMLSGSLIAEASLKGLPAASKTQPLRKQLQQVQQFQQVRQVKQVQSQDAFRSQPASVVPSLFGSPKAALESPSANAAPPLFGSLKAAFKLQPVNAAPPQFGSPKAAFKSQPLSAAPMSFGSYANTSRLQLADDGASPFGSKVASDAFKSQPANAASSLFGSSEAFQSQPASASLFGSPAAFKSQSASADPSRFGSSEAFKSQPASASLFGSSEEFQSQPASASLFGSPAAFQSQPASAAPSLFGSPKAAFQSQPASAAPSLFGSSAAFKSQPASSAPPLVGSSKAVFKSHPAAAAPMSLGSPAASIPPLFGSPVNVAPIRFGSFAASDSPSLRSAPHRTSFSHQTHSGEFVSKGVKQADVKKASQSVSEADSMKRTTAPADAVLVALKASQHQQPFLTKTRTEESAGSAERRYADTRTETTPQTITKDTMMGRFKGRRINTSVPVARDVRSMRQEMSDDSFLCDDNSDSDDDDWELEEECHKKSEGEPPAKPRVSMRAMSGVPMSGVPMSGVPHPLPVPAAPSPQLRVVGPSLPPHALHAKGTLPRGGGGGGGGGGPPPPSGPEVPGLFRARGYAQTSSRPPSGSGGPPPPAAAARRDGPPPRPLNNKARELSGAMGTPDAFFSILSRSMQKLVSYEATSSTPARGRPPLPPPGSRGSTVLHDVEAVKMKCLVNRSGLKVTVETVTSLLDGQKEDGSWDNIVPIHYSPSKTMPPMILRLIKDAGIEALGAEAVAMTIRFLSTAMCMLVLEDYQKRTGNDSDVMGRVTSAVAKAKTWLAEQEDLHPGLTSRAYPGFVPQSWIERGRVLLGVVEFGQTGVLVLKY